MKADINNDGRVSWSEFILLHEEHPRGSDVIREVKSEFKFLDANHDNYISPHEMMAHADHHMHGSVFHPHGGSAGRNADHDYGRAKHTQGAFASRHPQEPPDVPPEFTHFFEETTNFLGRADRNRDGKLSMPEFVQYVHVEHNTGDIWESQLHSSHAAALNGHSHYEEDDGDGGMHQPSHIRPDEHEQRRREKEEARGYDEYDKYYMGVPTRTEL